MEVNKPASKRPVKTYWPSYRKRSLFFVISMQIIASLTVAIAILITDVADARDLSFWITVIAILAATISINILAFTIVTEPFKMIVNALVHASGEPTNTTPPNPNAKRYQATGFTPLLQLVYELAADSESDKSTVKTTTEPQAPLAIALENTTTGLVIMNNQRVITYANSAAPTRVDNNGTLLLDLIFDQEKSLEQWLDECEKKSVHAETTWLRIANKLTGEKDRRIFDIIGSYQKGSEAEVVLTMIDRTGSYMPEDNDLDFIAFAAHELRGPITVIRGYLDTLEEDLSQRMQDDEKELFSRLIVSANRLSSYINNILNAAKYDRRHLSLHLHEETIADIYDSINDDMKLRAEAQNRLLNVHFPPNLPTVAADKPSVSEVIGNLIDNAIKYSNEGGTVTVSATSDATSVEVSVEDQGIGMPSNVVSNLFHKFYRSHRSRETVAGTGIGLYICKAMVESHGGKMSVRSVEGQGSVFSFSLPIYATVAEKLQANNDSNETFIKNHDGWIKNHGTYKG